MAAAAAVHDAARVGVPCLPPLQEVARQLLTADCSPLPFPSYHPSGSPRPLFPSYHPSDDLGPTLAVTLTLTQTLTLTLS